MLRIGKVEVMNRSPDRLRNPLARFAGWLKVFLNRVKDRPPSDIVI